MHDATVKEHAAQQRAAQLRAEAAAVSTMSTQSTMIMMCTVIGGDGMTTAWMTIVSIKGGQDRPAWVTHTHWRGTQAAAAAAAAASLRAERDARLQSQKAAEVALVVEECLWRVEVMSWCSLGVWCLPCAGVFWLCWRWCLCSWPPHPRGELKSAAALWRARH
jgi:hypothetical protein